MLFYGLWFYFQGIDDRVLVEIFLEGGSEFTAIVLDIGSGHDGHPVALLPTEVCSLSHNIYIKVSFIRFFFFFFLSVSKRMY